MSPPSATTAKNGMKTEMRFQPRICGLTMYENTAEPPPMVAIRNVSSDAVPDATSSFTVREASVERRGEIVVIELEAVSFLYKMVRTIAGTLVAVGKGTIPPAEISAILAARDRKAAFPTAPAWGLALVGVSYP